jgi:SPP1 gp7 family putative phage head morphogenesis protein
MALPILNTISTGFKSLVRSLASPDPQQVPDNKRIPDSRKRALATYKIRQVRPLRIDLQLNRWRDALVLAEDPYIHNRYRLYALYREAMRDPHLISQAQLVESKILCEPYILVKKGTVGHNTTREEVTGTDDQDSTNYLKFFQRPWFMEYMKYAIQSDQYGHSLIEFNEMAPSDTGIVEQEFSAIELVPREHVKPEWGEILVYPQELHGFSYREAPFSDWLIEIGNKNSLGWLMSATREAIWKAQTRSDWARYNERFGMPTVHIGAATNDDKELDKLEEMAANMGSSGYLISDKDDVINFLETTGSKGSGMNTYQALATYCDTMMSKVVTSQTLSSDSGQGGSGSYALGNVHEDTLDDIIKARMMMRQFEINYTLMPFLAKKYNLPQLMDYEWRYVNLLKPAPVADQDADGDPTDRDEMGNDADPNNKKASGVRRQASEKPVKKKAAPGAAKKKALGVFTGNEASGIRRQASGEIKLAAGTDEFLDEMARFAYDNYEDTGLLNTDVYLKIAGQMFDRFTKGFNTGYKTGDGGPGAFQAYIQDNLFPFSAAKNYSQMKDMRDRLMDDQGKIKSFGRFRDDVASISQDYNQNWLQSEYNYVQKSGIMAAQWQNIILDKETYPYLMYTTRMDDKVRPEHAALQGITLKVDDPFWNKYYPPNGWNCRCTVKQLQTHEATPSDPRAAGKLAKAEKIPELFQNNVGKSKMELSNGHPYYDVKSLQYIRALKAEANYGLRPVSTILKNDNLPEGKPNIKDIEAYEAYQKSFKDRHPDGIEDATGINLQMKNFDKALKKPEEKRWSYSNRIEDIIQNPNEVYSFYERPLEGKNLTRSYIKFYDDGAYILLADVLGNKLTVRTWYKWDGEIARMNEVRKGILLHLKRTRF